jgi:hypothetical protein
MNKPFISTPKLNFTTEKLSMCFSKKIIFFQKKCQSTATAAPWVVGTKEK